jgi:hypothetical protein
MGFARLYYTRFDRLYNLLESELATGQHQHGEEPVHLAWISLEVRRYVGFLQTSGVSLAFIE